MTQHSPTPWTLDGEHIFDDILAHVATVDFSDDDEPTITGRGTLPAGTGRNNADFIVRAVNCHDDLLAACRAAFDELASLNDNQDLIDQLDSAITKAEGKAVQP